MKSPIRWLQLAVIAAAAASATHALAQAGGPPRGGIRGPGPADLLQIEVVQTDLAMVDDQKSAAIKLGEESRELMAGLRDLSQEERRQKMGEVREKLQKKVDELLKPEQRDRLEQIVIQMQGADALSRPEVAEKLGLTDDQKQKLDSLSQEMRDKRRELFNSGSDPQEVGKKIEEIRAQHAEKANAVITDQQRQQLEKLKGKKIEIDRSQLFRGLGPGGNRPPGA